MTKDSFYVRTSIALESPGVNHRWSCPIMLRTAKLMRGTQTTVVSTDWEKSPELCARPAGARPVSHCGTACGAANPAPLFFQAVGAQTEGEPAALAHGAFHDDGPAMQLHQAPSDGQSQAGALFGGAGGPYLVKLVEDRLQLRFRNADSGVAHREARGIFAAGVGNPHAAVLGSELHRVAHQVVKHLLEARPVGENRNGAGNLVFDRDMLDCRQRRDHRENFLQNIGRADRFAVQIHASD